MTVFGFNNRRDAENLSHFSKTMNFERGRKIGAPDGLETILVKAPSDGIDAKASGQCSSAQCLVVHIADDGEVVDNTNEVEVWNFTEEDVEANAYISCFRFRESWVFDGGVGVDVKHVKSPAAGITGTQSGNYGDNMYSATCTVRVQDSGTQGSASYIDAFPSETIDVWNPHPDKILGNVDFVAMYDGSYWFALLPNSTGRIFLTPAAGISARTGTTAGSATCTIVNTNGPNMSVSSETQTVYNVFGSAIGGDVYITAKRNDNGDWIADAEDC